MAGLDQFSELFANPLFTEIINEVPVDTKYIGQRFLPIDTTYDIDFHETVLSRQADMADIVDRGAELPLTDGDPMRRVSGEITDIGQSHIVTKKELAALSDKGNDGKRKIAEKQLLNKSARIKQNVDARMEWLRWQALGTGQLVYNKGGIILGVDFGIPAGNKVAPLVKWDQNNATILSDYQGWVQAYVALNGEMPEVFVTSLTVIYEVLSDPGVIAAIKGDNATKALITIDELNTFLRGRKLPPMEAFDAQVTYRDVDNGGVRVSQRLLSEKVGVFLKEGGAIGSQLLGPTVENNMEPGIFGRTFQMERPYRQVIEVVAASFPKVMEPDLIKIATVLS